MSDTIPGIIKVGDYFTMGWNYYEERHHILKALKDFDAKAYAVGLKEELLAEDSKVETAEFYTKLIERWTVLGYVEEIKITQQYLGSVISCDNLARIDPNAWEAV